MFEVDKCLVVLFIVNTVLYYYSLDNCNNLRIKVIEHIVLLAQVRSSKKVCTLLGRRETSQGSGFFSNVLLLSQLAQR